MYTPEPITMDLVPYTKRVLLKQNARLFVDGRGGRSRGASRVLPQSLDCANKSAGTPCGFWNNQYHGSCDMNENCIPYSYGP